MLIFTFMPLLAVEYMLAIEVEVFVVSERQIFKYAGSVEEHAGSEFWLRNKKLYSDNPWCPYCRAVTKPVFEKHRRQEPDSDDPLQSWSDDSEYVRACSSCGWWDILKKNTMGDCDDPPWYSDTYRRAILEVHRLADPRIPIEVLGQEIKKRHDSIHSIHHKAMERLVESVMRDFYPHAEVELCGRKGDGGIDLLIVKGEETIGVQIKRRINPDKPESVCAVREFLGAGVDKDIRNLIFVTSAPRFTDTQDGAKAFAERNVGNNKVEQFELIDRDRFIGMLDLAVTDEEFEPWRNHCGLLG